MAFHIDSHDLPPIRCYGDALAYWNRIKPWRGDADTNSRPLAGRKKRHMTIRKGDDDSIIMRLWQTDVVTYHKNGDLTLSAYSSVSTNAFASRLTPYAVGVTWTNELGYMLHLTRDNITHTVRQSSHLITLRRDPINGDWAPVDASMLRPFIKYAVDVKRANAALKETNFKDYVAWLKALRAMGQKFQVDRWNRDVLRPAQVVDLLKQGVESWATVAEASGGDEDAVRQSLYAHFQCVDKIEVPYVVGFDTSSLRASHRRWSHIVNRY